MVLKVGHRGHQGISGSFKRDCDSSNLRFEVSCVFGGPVKKFGELVHGLGCFCERESRSSESDNLHGGALVVEWDLRAAEGMMVGLRVREKRRTEECFLFPRARCENSRLHGIRCLEAAVPATDTKKVSSCVLLPKLSAPFHPDPN